MTQTKREDERLIVFKAFEDVIAYGDAVAHMDELFRRL
jgi:hypothetical protein